MHAHSASPKLSFLNAPGTRTSNYSLLAFCLCKSLGHFLALHLAVVRVETSQNLNFWVGRGSGPSGLTRSTHLHPHTQVFTEIVLG